MTTKLSETELVKTVFSNPKGEELLEYWNEIYMNRTSFHPENTPEATSFNEGLRAFVLAIHSLLKEN